MITIEEKKIIEDELIEIPCDSCEYINVCHICSECGINNKWKMYKSIFNE